MSVLYRTYSRPVPMEVIVRSSNYAGMHPVMQDRVRALMEASGGAAGWGYGLRTSQQQLQLFLSRHRLDPNGKVLYNGQRYTLTGTPAARPGRSMHEIGLAADLRGRATNNPRFDDCSWIVANAERFGLVTFAEVNNEPWHVQPIELPHARSSYEQRGAAWGSYPDYRGGGSGSASTTVTTKPIDATRSLTRAREDLATRGLTPALVARPGERGPAVWVLREALVARGLLPTGSPTRDHPYDAQTVAIVRAFQQERSLEVDGIVGPMTWGALLGAIEPDENSPMVMVLKAVLIVRGLIRDNAANRATDYGPITQQRVRDFQALSGIEAIARVGPQTWTALLGVKRRIDLSGRGDEVDEQGETDGEAVENFDDVDLDDLDLLGLLDEVPAT